MTSPRRGGFRVGMSGFQYEDWAGDFYPVGLPKADWLPTYAQAFDTVELNRPFYRLPESSTFAKWQEQVPAGFSFAVKFSKYGSHIRKLMDPGNTVPLFLERARHLGRTLGPILVQLPPRWHADPTRLDAFLSVCRAEGDERWVVEFRDATWLSEEVFAILRRHRAALCIHDLLPDHPRIVTGDLVYLRFHGGHNGAPLYGGRYSKRELGAVARDIERWRGEKLDVYAYFNNTRDGDGIQDALVLRRLVFGADPAPARPRAGVRSGRTAEGARTTKAAPERSPRQRPARMMQAPRPRAAVKKRPGVDSNH
jgi:uncharacterized protein YecE (DUF72 family)